MVKCPDNLKGKMLKFKFRKKIKDNSWGEN